MRIKSADLRRGAFGQPSVPILLSRRAHLFTTPKGRWYFLRKPCALRGGCGSCGSLMDNAASHHCPRSRLNVLLRMHNKGMAICHPLSRLPAKICHRQFYRSYGYRSCDTHFLFAKKKQKRKDGEDGWRSTTWKPRWSAVVQEEALLQLPLI